MLLFVLVRSGLIYYAEVFEDQYAETIIKIVLGSDDFNRNKENWKKLSAEIQERYLKAYKVESKDEILRLAGAYHNLPANPEDVQVDERYVVCVETQFAPIPQFLYTSAHLTYWQIKTIYDEISIYSKMVKEFDFQLFENEDDDSKITYFGSDNIIDNLEELQKLCRNEVEFYIKLIKTSLSDPDKIAGFIANMEEENQPNQPACELLKIEIDDPTPEAYNSIWVAMARINALVLEFLQYLQAGREIGDPIGNYKETWEELISNLNHGKLEIPPYLQAYNKFTGSGSDDNGYEGPGGGDDGDGGSGGGGFDGGNQQSPFNNQNSPTHFDNNLSQPQSSQQSQNTDSSAYTTNNTLSHDANPFGGTQFDSGNGPYQQGGMSQQQSSFFGNYHNQ